jgi:hypothetical protein
MLSFLFLLKSRLFLCYFIEFGRAAPINFSLEAVFFIILLIIVEHLFCFGLFFFVGGLGLIILDIVRHAFESELFAQVGVCLHEIVLGKCVFVW